MGKLTTVKCLVTELGADVNQACKDDGTTPMMLAASHEHLDVLSCLLEHGAEVDKADNRKSTPLSMAASVGSLAVVSCLLKSKADVNHADIQARSPLFLAAQRGYLSVVRCLLNHGANVNQASNVGVTSLMAASAYKHAEVVTWLVKAGADTQALWTDFADGTAVTAADLSREFGASAAQTAYLEAKTHCSSTGCSGAGFVNCTRCKNARYCGEPCQFAHWKAHKADCKRWSAELMAGK
jgi:hypothetical protein